MVSGIFYGILQAVSLIFSLIRAAAMLDGFTDAQLGNVIIMLQAMKQTIEDALAADTPNAVTTAAIEELENGGGERWTGSTEDLFAMLDAEDDPNA